MNYVSWVLFQDFSYLSWTYLSFIGNFHDVMITFLCIFLVPRGRILKTSVIPTPGQTSHLSSKISQHLSDRLAHILVQTFVVSRGWSLITLVIVWLSIRLKNISITREWIAMKFCVDFNTTSRSKFSLPNPVKYLNIYLTALDTFWNRHSWFPVGEAE